MKTEMTQSGVLPEVPLDPVISPSALQSSYASIDVTTGAWIQVPAGGCTEGHQETRAIEGVPLDDSQQ
jgi:hypothetical protein